MKVITMSYDNKRQTSTLYGSTCEVRGGTSEVPRRKVKSVRSWHISVSNINIDSVSNDFDIRGCGIETGRNVGVHLSYLEHRSDRTDGNHEAIPNESILSILLNHERVSKQERDIKLEDRIKC